MLPNPVKYLKKKIGASKHVRYRKSLIDEINNQTQPTTPYFLLLICASIIAALGLLTNNVILVIGSMIIAPIYWPIIGMALGIAALNYKLLKRSFLMTLVSVFLSILLSFVAASLAPLNGLNPLISLTSSSNILHLVVAAASTLGGIAAVYYPAASVSIVGVAVSLSLIPPLASAGLGLALGSGEVFWGAFRLLAANIVVIVFVGAVTFYFLRIRSKQKKLGHFWLVLFGVGIITLMLSVPLTNSLRQTQLRLKEEEIIRQQVEEILDNRYPEVELFEIKLESLSDQTSAWRATVILLAPDGSILNENSLKLIERELEQKHQFLVLFDWHKLKTEKF